MDKYSLDIDAINQALVILQGKWKIQIISTLSNKKSYRFNELMKAIDGIGTKMLSSDLKILENNKIIERHVLDSHPVIIEYSLSLYGQTLSKLLYEMSEWGITHRNKQKGYNPNSHINHFLTIDI
ncbi:winged helix-turn-helix transcriptional regulator [Myroides indicus]|uniref:HxlR family transcriptional regulator n=1 Tax=Myroides indicus TaxID=1323422 RepID=A0A4R7F8G3_9FLAO|nr:helix-turn-helix domain-containing protein [Myroides indicus]TDS66259.1 HxlR family transcriptional regulator [Myroides indicus]